jgi:aspartyl-tRNA(Asn)/glutamyl-tRNA(Gln) amidotransferase subunit B
MAPETRSAYEAVIGLEVHCQLLTESKVFSSDANRYGSRPNTNISVITLGHPGTLPRLNKKAVDYAIRMGLACNCEISRYNVFARKNYFYPDLPKGYQLSQDKTPICKGGYVGIKTKDGAESGWCSTAFTSKKTPASRFTWPGKPTRWWTSTAPVRPSSRS